MKNFITILWRSMFEIEYVVSFRGQSLHDLRGCKACLYNPFSSPRSRFIYASPDHDACGFDAMEPSHTLQQQQQRETNLGRKLRRFTSPSGFGVLVGNDNAQNDVLTFQIAEANDLWFHGRDVAGSHVLMRVQPGEVPTKKDLQFAADLAAYYSKARGSRKVEVSCTSPKHLKKVKGKPGSVTILEETIIRAQALELPKQIEDSTSY